MKTLLLLRHAKSSWKHPELADHDRPLNKRGKQAAPGLGTLLVERELLPQQILCSTAVRTRQTAEALVESSHYTGPVQYLEALYMAEPAAYLSALRSLPDDLERVLVIGHNPGLEGLVQLLGGQIVALPTAALAHLVLPISSWQALNLEAQGELVQVFLPQADEEVEIRPQEKPQTASKEQTKKKDEKKPEQKKEPKKDTKKDKKKNKK